ncbi:MAG TPA: hypothetical protein VMS30_05595 [Phycisphaerales bacterium]|nr:hypothetical protein [Phycisphaerales bacterium]
MIMLLMLSAVADTAAMEAKPQDPPGEPGGGDPNNAATWYRAAYAETKRISFNTTEEYEPVWAFQMDPDRGPSSDARAIIRRSREAANLTKRGTRRETCDFGPYDPFDDASAGNLAALRTLSAVLQDDFLVRVFDGNTSEAMEDISGVCLIARHAASQKSLMPALVAAALTSRADRLIQHAIDRAIITPNEATRLLRDLEEFKGEDPLGFRDAMIVSQSAYIEALIARYSGDDGLQRLRDDQLPFYRQQDEKDTIAALETMTRQELDQVLSELRAIQQRIVSAMRLDDPAATQRSLEAIDKEMRGAKFGRILQASSGFTSRTFEVMHRVRKTLDDRITTLRGLADGSVDPLSLANAACWYIRASVQIEQVDPEALALIDAHAANADPNAEVDPKLAEALRRDDVRAVLERLAAAATIERCDFSYATGNWTRYYRPYHAGVLACGRLLAVDAMRLVGEGQRDEAVARLAQLLRLSSEISHDGCIAGSLTGHRLFESADPVIASLVERGLTDDQITVLRSAMKRFSRGDPFHYQPSIASVRENARGWLMWLLRGAPSAAEQIAAGPRVTTQQETDDADAILNRCDADRVLSLLAACEEQSMHFGQVPHPIRPPIDGLWPIFDVEALTRCREMLPAVIQWAKMHAISALPQADLPVIAPIEARARQSIDDFRACLRRLGMSAIEPPATTQP